MIKICNLKPDQWVLMTIYRRWNSWTRYQRKSPGG
jgi:hypothetical protein